MKLPSRYLSICLASAAFLFFLAAPAAVQAQPVRQQHASAGNSIVYLQGKRDVQLPDTYEMNASIPAGSTSIPPRAYWVSQVYQNVAFAAGTWTLHIAVQVNTSPSINIYSLAVLDTRGTFLRYIGGPVSHRYNALGPQSDTISFPSGSVQLQNERVELYYIVPNWCTAAPIHLGATTYLHLPTQHQVRMSLGRKEPSPAIALSGDGLQRRNATPGEKEVE